jgi:hypothetical protein
MRRVGKQWPSNVRSRGKSEWGRRESTSRGRFEGENRRKYKEAEKTKIKKNRGSEGTERGK